MESSSSSSSTGFNIVEEDGCIAFVDSWISIKGLEILQKLHELGNLVGDKTPVVSIIWSQLCPRIIEHPTLRNYLVEMQSRSSDGGKVASVFAMVDEAENVSFTLEMNKQLLKLLVRILGNPCVTVYLDLTNDDLGGSGFGGNANISDLINRGNSTAIYYNYENVYFTDLLYDVPRKFVVLKQEYNSLFCAGHQDDKTLTKSFLEKFAEYSFSLILKIEVVRSEVQFERKSYSNFVLKSMYHLEDSQKDLTIVVKNETEIKCHRSVLIAQSSVFSSMLSAEYGMKEVQTGRIEMLENSEEGVSQFVKLMYGFDITEETMSPDVAIELLQLADKYNIQELEGDMADILLKKKMDWYASVDNMMELYYFVRDSDIPSFGMLKAHALTELTQLSSNAIVSSDYFKKLDADEKITFLGILMDYNRIKK